MEIFHRLSKRTGSFQNGGPLCAAFTVYHKGYLAFVISKLVVPFCYYLSHLTKHINKLFPSIGSQRCAERPWTGVIV